MGMPSGCDGVHSAPGGCLARPWTGIVGCLVETAAFHGLSPWRCAQICKGGDVAGGCVW